SANVWPGSFARLVGSRRVLRPRALTLFPYTTLFRSRDHGQRRPPPAPGQRRGEEAHDLEQNEGHGQGQAARQGQLDAGDEGFGRDRKSTRLNSSHVKISYAVFCLKKKTKAKRCPTRN